MPVTEVVLADSVESLQRALELLEPLRVLGVDVERADWDRYYRAAALVQVGGDGRVAVIDPLALPDLPALHDLLFERMVVFHALENDLDPIATLGVVPPDVQDTSIAASVLGLPTGLETLLRELLGVDLGGDKQAMQRANWEARPLTPAMLDYAAGDVADLPALWTQLQQRLDTTGRAAWYAQELAAVLALPSVETRRAWSRTKGMGRLDSGARARLRALWDAREELARSTNTAPGRIASDTVLIDLATTPPSKVAELGRRGMRRQAVRTFGSALIAALESVDSAAREPRRGVRPPTEADRAHAETLRRLRSQQAEELGIEAGVLCPNRMLMSALLSDPATPAELAIALGLRPWQWEQLGAAFCEALDLQGPGKPAPVTAEVRTPTMADLLNPDALHHALDQLDGWAGTTSGLHKSYRFDDEGAASTFADRVARIADGMNHHPEVTTTGSDVRLKLVTHSAGGVTQQDLDLATAIDTGEAHGDANLDNPRAGETD